MKDSCVSDAVPAFRNHCHRNHFHMHGPPAFSLFFKDRIFRPGLVPSNPDFNTREGHHERTTDIETP